MYVVLKKGRPEELGEVAYEIVKMLTRDDIFRVSTFTNYVERVGMIDTSKNP